MKKLLLIISASLIFANTYSQTILGFTVDPATPSTTDFVKVYVDLEFGYSNCDVDSKGHSTAGTATDAYAHHCQGMLATICNITDTFDLGFLPAGANVFRFTLSSGFGGPGCSPGIVPDGTDSVNFIVTPSTGIADLNWNGAQVLFYPNPMITNAKLLVHPSVKIKNAELRIINVLGKTLHTAKNIQTNEISIHSDGMPKGIYFYELSEAGKVINTGKFRVE